MLLGNYVEWIPICNRVFVSLTCFGFNFSPSARLVFNVLRFSVSEKKKKKGTSELNFINSV